MIDDKEESLQERQENELQVLQSIFMEDLKDLRLKNAWKIWRPPELLITLKPQQSMTVCKEIHVQVDMYVKYTNNYPNEIPKLELKNTKGLSMQIVAELQKQLINLAHTLKGEVMIYELSQYVQNFLHQHNKPQFKSFYEEMVHNKKCTEEKEAKEIKRKQEIQKLREHREIQEEIHRKQEALKKKSRKRKESHRRSNSYEDSDSEEEKINKAKNIENKTDGKINFNHERCENLYQNIENNEKNNIIKDNDSVQTFHQLAQQIPENSRLLKEFDILQWLGSGGFGDVLKVQNKLDSRIYAIKKILLNPSNKQLNRKIMREVKLLSSLNHENVVRYYHSWIETTTELSPNDTEESSSDITKYESEKSFADKLLNSKINKIEELAPPLPEGSVEWSLSCKHESRLQEDDDDDLSDDDVFGISFLHFASDSDSSESVLFEDSESKSKKDEAYGSSVIENDSQLVKNSEMRTFQFMYIQMEFCEKSTLRTAIDEGLYKETHRIWRFFREIIEGLCHIHQQGMIHRDLKPVNIFLDCNDHVKIGDFGLATTDILLKPLSTLESNVGEGQVTDASDFSRLEIDDYTKTGRVGTALYVAPELINVSSSRIIYNQKVDIYSLGIIFFEMCYPKLSTGMERVKILANLRLPDVVFPNDVEEQLSEQQIYLIKWLLDHDVRKRPTSYELLASEYMPPPQMEETEINEMLRHIVFNPQSKAYKRMISTLFKQETSIASDVTYDMDLHKIMPLRQSSLAMSKVINILEKIMKRHGAVNWSVPTLMPKSSVYKNNESCVHVMNHGGGIVTLPHDLRVPFARYIARREITNFKRYTFGKVFRERKVYGFHPRELYECAFDIVTTNPAGFLPDAEVLKVISEIINEIPVLQSRNYIIHMNHISLLKALFMHCGIPEEKYNSVYEILSDNKKENVSRYQIQNKLINLGLGEQSVASFCHYIELKELHSKLESYFIAIIRRKNHAAALAKQGVRELQSVITNAESLDVKIPIVISPGLTYGINIYSGIIFQIKYETKKNNQKCGMDVLAAGGRYDKLINSFSSDTNKENQSAVGVSIAVDRIISAMIENEEVSSEIDVLVCSIGTKSMIKDKCMILQELWANGIRSYVIYDTTQSLEEITEFCQNYKILHIIILKDGETGIIKVQTIDKEKFFEKKLLLNELADYILKYSQNKWEQVDNFKSEIVRSNSGSDNFSGSQTKITFLPKGKITFNIKKRSEIQIMSQLASALQCFSSKINIEVIAVDLPNSVIKTIVSHIELENEDIFENSISEIIEKHNREKKYLTKIMDQIHELRFEKKCQVIALYSLIDCCHKIIM